MAVLCVLHTTYLYEERETHHGVCRNVLQDALSYDVYATKRYMSSCAESRYDCVKYMCWTYLLKPTYSQSYTTNLNINNSLSISDHYNLTSYFPLKACKHPGLLVNWTPILHYPTSIWIESLTLNLAISLYIKITGFECCRSLCVTLE